MEELIELVRAQEVLYNYNDKNYHDTSKKDGMWREIGGKLNKSGQECKKQWTSLRDGFRRALRKRKTISGQAAAQYKKWKYEEEMSFLLPFMQDRAMVSSLDVSHSSNDETEAVVDDNYVKSQQTEFVNDDENDNHNNTVQLSAAATRKSVDVPCQRSVSAQKKTKRADQPTASSVLMQYLLDKNAKTEKQDEVEALFYGLAQTVKRLTPYYRALAKAKVCSLIGDLELQNLTSQQRYHSPTPSHLSSMSHPSTSTPSPMSSVDLIIPSGPSSANSLPSTHSTTGGYYDTFAQGITEHTPNF